MAIHPLIDQERDYIISLRRWFHSHPELSMKEFETARRIEEGLAAIGVPTRRVGGTGVLGTIQGRRGPGKKIVLRADTDALPIRDEKTVPYASQCPGVMHACGHDAHTDALLGAARVLKQLEDTFAGEIALVFQPGAFGGCKKSPPSLCACPFSAIYGLNYAGLGYPDNGILLGAVS